MGAERDKRRQSRPDSRAANTLESQPDQLAAYSTPGALTGSTGETRSFRSDESGFSKETFSTAGDEQRAKPTSDSSPYTQYGSRVRAVLGAIRANFNKKLLGQIVDGIKHSLNPMNMGRQLKNDWKALWDPSLRTSPVDPETHAEVAAVQRRRVNIALLASEFGSLTIGTACALAGYALSHGNPRIMLAAWIAGDWAGAVGTYQVEWIKQNWRHYQSAFKASPWRALRDWASDSLPLHLTASSLASPIYGISGGVGLAVQTAIRSQWPELPHLQLLGFLAAGWSSWVIGSSIYTVAMQPAIDALMPYLGWQRFKSNQGLKTPHKGSTLQNPHLRTPIKSL